MTLSWIARSARVALPFLSLGCLTGVAAKAVPAEAGPELFAPEALKASGRITLTPGFTPDGRTMYFAQSDCIPIWECPQRLKASTRTANGWSKPIIVDLPQDARVDYPSVTPDGRFLLFSWAAKREIYQGRDADSTNFDLWRLDLSRPDATPEPIDGPDLNRLRAGEVATLRFVNNETAPVMTEAGNLYFWSERLDGLGDRDIYVALNDGRGGLKAPMPLPAPVNTAGRDDGAWVTPDGRTMLMTSSDRGGCGGSDLFVTRKTDEGWREPQNLGCHINSEADDYAGTLIPGTSRLVFASTRMAEGLRPGTVALWSVAVDLD
ncbi:MAG: hypothetical protein WA906_10535 [Pacificimonas sp.]